MYILGTIYQRTDQQPASSSIGVVKNVVMLFLALFRLFKSMKPLSFDSPAETDVVRRLPTAAKVFCVHLGWEYIYI